MEQFVITNALVYTGHRFVPREVYVEEGRVAQLAEKVNAPAGCPRLDLGGKRLVPGFIDIHTHGAAGVDVNAATAAQLNGTIGHFFASQAPPAGCAACSPTRLSRPSGAWTRPKPP